MISLIPVSTVACDCLRHYKCHLRFAPKTGWPDGLIERQVNYRIRIDQSSAKNRPKATTRTGNSCSTHHSVEQFWLYKALNGLSSPYLADDCQLTTTTGRRRLNSPYSIVQHRHVWGSKNSHKSGWSLIHCCWTASVERPTSHLRDSQHTFPEFRRLRKTHLFCWGQRRLMTVLNVCFLSTL